MFKYLAVIVTAMFISSAAIASGFIDFTTIAKREINTINRNLSNCNITTVDVRGRYPRPYPIDADFGLYSADSRLLAVGKQRILRGGIQWDISNINGGYRYKIRYNQNQIDFNAPFNPNMPRHPQNAANGRNVNWGGNIIAKGYCGGYEVQSIEQFNHCILVNFTQRLTNDLCSISK